MTAQTIEHYSHRKMMGADTPQLPRFEVPVEYLIGDFQWKAFAEFIE